MRQIPQQTKFQEFTIRPFMEQDRATILQFWLSLDQHVLTHLSSAKRYIKSNDYPGFVNKWLSQYQQNRHSLLLVGESEQVVSGFILAHIQSQNWYKEKYTGLISACYVNSLYRRRGLASQMLSEVKVWFGEEKVNYIDVTWDDGNLEAEKFWRSSGFEPSQVRANHKLT
ncbi:hypothetical protein MNBD_GAMMA12-130 [hydrothermal vent metagenome]|uniref:N-acetyltransferase domain-containing protein n=1 Tax=hydrothermal vent metagenome TaxID=652676 RepID=A0A3B0YDM4_9ZZZZ